MKIYNSYKDSNIEWIGKIPSHWTILRGKYWTKIISGFAFDSNKFTKEEGYIGLIRIRDIYKTETEMNYKGSYSKDAIVQTGDILIGMDGDFNIERWKGKPALLNQRVCKICNTKKGNENYLFYLLPRLLKCINDVTYSTTVKHLSVYDIINSELPLPPLSEQQAIATYLDKKCGEINHAIDVQKKKIDLLNELKQTIITDAVTKGLNPNAPMKDSGMEWIGKIPAHWDVMKTSLAFNHIGSGTTPSTSKREYYDDEGAYWLQTGDLTDGLIVNTSKKVSKIAVRECNLKFYPPNSVVIAMYGATIGKMGLLQIQCATNQACCVLPSNKHINAKYTFYFFLSAKSDLLISAIGGGQPNISQDVIKKTKIILPPFSEQQDIVRHLDKECGKIDAQISKANRRIDLLEELKQSIITEAVTGKIKVC